VGQYRSNPELLAHNSSAPESATINQKVIIRGMINPQNLIITCAILAKLASLLSIV
jgi:hypothetical protein